MAKVTIRGKFMDLNAHIRKQGKLKSNGPRIIFRILEKEQKSNLQKVGESNKD